LTASPLPINCSIAVFARLREILVYFSIALTDQAVVPLSPPVPQAMTR
jgi:hypothetical protein